MSVLELHIITHENANNCYVFSLHHRVMFAVSLSETLSGTQTNSQADVHTFAALYIQLSCVYPTCVCSYSDREWHNTHEDLHRPTIGDPGNLRPDTIVHLDEFRALIQEALNASRVPGSKDEL